MSVYIFFSAFMKPNKFPLYLQKFLDWFAIHKDIPNNKIMTNILGVSSRDTVWRFMKHLVETWYLTVSDQWYLPTLQLTGIEYYEDTILPAWFPTPGQDDAKYKIDLNTLLIDRPHAMFTARVKGDSMIDAQIRDGDLALVDRSRKPAIWDIVVANVDWWYTIKYYQQDTQGIVFLQPANSDYDVIYPSQELIIYGVVTGIVRKY
jgi:DNA polymerase V